MVLKTRRKKKSLEGGVVYNNIAPFITISHTLRRNTMIKPRRKCSDFKSPLPTCYTRDELITLVEEWNDNNPKRKIVKTKSSTKTELWNKLRERHGNVNEDTWSNSSALKAAFAPITRLSWKQNKNTWLDEDDIARVMKCFQKNFVKFHYIHPPPIDFDERDPINKQRCAYSILCNYNYKDLASKYNTFGVIFNTDVNDGPGKHWVALFVDLVKGEISYFDSVGDEPPKEVNKLIKRLKKQGNEYFKMNGLNRKIKININRTQHQHERTECGVYCLTFIYYMLKIGEFDHFNSRPIYDFDIETLRGYFFDDGNRVYTPKSCGPNDDHQHILCKITN